MDKQAALDAISAHRGELTRQQLLTLRGQVLSGDIKGAMRGLARIIQIGGDAHG